MKRNRRDRIIELVSGRKIETQKELASLLSSEGYAVTQATVSRDIRSLRLMKITGMDGHQYYSLPGQAEQDDTDRYVRILVGAVISMEEAGNLVVVRTAPGMAMACASVLDRLKIPQIAGCIAGDDTIMAAVHNEAEASDVIKQIRAWMGH